jgi:hypothetical protein
LKNNYSGAKLRKERFYTFLLSKDNKAVRKWLRFYVWGANGFDNEACLKKADWDYQKEK